MSSIEHVSPIPIGGNESLHVHSFRSLPTMALNVAARKIDRLLQ